MKSDSPISFDKSNNQLKKKQSDKKEIRLTIKKRRVKKPLLVFMPDKEKFIQLIVNAAESFNP